MSQFSSSQPSRPSSGGWLSASQFAAFTAAQTDAHRLCTTAGGWVERFGDDILVSFKDGAAHAALVDGVHDWSLANAFAPRRIFGKFLPRQNEDRISPELDYGDAAIPLLTTVTENGVRYGLDFGRAIPPGSLSISAPIARSLPGQPRNGCSIPLPTPARFL